jgi:hypothetical protein
MPCLDGEVVHGVDTHADTHTAALVDALGRTLATRMIPANRRGSRALLAWARRHGTLRRAGWRAPARTARRWRASLPARLSR